MEALDYDKIKQLLAHEDPTNQELCLHFLKALGLIDDVDLLCLMTDRVKKLYWCIRYEWMDKLGQYSNPLLHFHPEKILELKSTLKNCKIKV